MAASSETEINLKTLQRVDSSIVEIIDNASQVAIYKYERKLEKWEGTDIEGTLFLYRRCTYPYHGFIIVNRMSTTNFVESITSDMQFQLQEPYLLYKNHTGDIFGSWFYEDRDLRRISNKIQTIVLTQVTTPKRQRCASESETQPKKDEVIVQDVMTLLSQAHEEFVRNMPSTKNGNVDIKKSDNKFLSYPEKKDDSNKIMNSVGVCENSMMPAVSQKEHQISPRRRFLSTGSFESSLTHSLPLTSHEFSSEHIMRKKKNLYSTTEGEKLMSSKNAFSSEFSDGSISTPSHKFEASSAPTRLSPLFSHGEIMSPLSDIGVLEESFESYESETYLTSKPQARKNLFPTPNQKSSLDSMKITKTNFNSSYENHSEAVKNALISHIEDNPDILLKIHEAYVSSLKSFFI